MDTTTCLFQSFLCAQCRCTVSAHVILLIVSSLYFVLLACACAVSVDCVPMYTCAVFKRYHIEVYPKSGYLLKFLVQMQACGWIWSALMFINTTI